MSMSVTDYKADKDTNLSPYATKWYNWANQYQIPFEIIDWKKGDDTALEILQPFLQHGYINDPDFAIQKSGFDIYQQMLRDPVIEGSLTIRKKAVSSLDFAIVPHSEGHPKKQKKEAVNLTRIFRGINNRNLFLDNILDAIPKGSSYNEIIWVSSRQGWTVPKDIYPLDKQRIIWTNRGEMRIRTLTSPIVGARLVPKEKNVKAGKILVTYYNQDDTNSSLSARYLGYKYFGRGLGDALWRYYFIKYNSFGQAARYGERFARPMILLSIPKGADEDTTKMANEITKLRRQGLIIQWVDPSRPEAYKMTYMEPGSRGSEFLLKLVQLCDDSIRSLILGQNLTAPAGGGSQGQNVVLNDVRADLKVSDIEMVEGTVNNQLLPWIRKYNPSKFDLSEPCPQFKLEYRKARDERLEMDRYRMMQGMVIKSEEFYDNMNKEMPPNTPEWMVYQGDSMKGTSGGSVLPMVGQDMFGKKADAMESI